MLEILFGNKNVYKILLFLFVNNKCYGTQLQDLLSQPLTPIQKALAKLEKAGILVSYYEGKTRLYQFNPSLPWQNELDQLLKKAYTLLSPKEKKELYIVNMKNQTKSSLNTLLTFWKMLSSVSLVSFLSKVNSEEETGKNGEGRGEVFLTKTGDNTLIFQEKGSWQGTLGEEMSFSNTFRWTLDRNTKVIALEHLRRGIDHPIFLFYLTPTGPNTLASIDPHFCAADVYMGQVKLNKTSFQLHWRIIGPKKNEEIEYNYHLKH